jgi:hypothetical protein
VDLPLEPQILGQSPLTELWSGPGEKVAFNYVNSL